MITRRRFLTAATTTFFIPSTFAGANSSLRIAVIGCRVRGPQLARQFLEIPGVTLAALCDPDSAVLEKCKASLNSPPKKKKDAEASPDDAREPGKVFSWNGDLVQDYRKILDRRDIDAVAIAAPNYWHALMAIQACQAGKDVYLEKPVCHDVWEGARILEAAKKYKRIVAAGLQNRSDKGVRAALEWLPSSGFGKLTALRAIVMRERTGIGARLPSPLAPPDTCDYNLWLGPCQDQPIYRPQFHYDWHWVWNTGGGDTANQGPHELDLARLFLGNPPPPRRVLALGGRFAWNDAGETPNILLAHIEHDGLPPLLFELCDLCISPTVKSAPSYKGTRVGLIATYENGELRGGRGGMMAYNPAGERIEKFPGDGGGTHAANFIEAVRSRKGDGLRTTLPQGYLSSILPAIANISHRTGNPGTLADAEKHAAPGGEAMAVCVRDFGTQLAQWNVDPDQPLWSLGADLQLDANAASALGTPWASGNPSADAHLKRDYRAPFVVPAKV